MLSSQAWDCAGMITAATGHPCFNVVISQGRMGGCVEGWVVVGSRVGIYG